MKGILKNKNKEENNVPDFLKTSNTRMLIDIVIDSELLKIEDNDGIQDFVLQMKEFLKREKTGGKSKSLVELNKDFINSLIDHKPSEKIKITAEDIQADRISSFQRDLDRRKNDFQDAVQLKVPETPKFADDVDKPITEMESLISKTMAERNFDIERFKTTHHSNSTQVQQFLKSQETSMKPQPPPQPPKNIKYIKIDSRDLNVKQTDIIELTPPTPNINSNPIFSKLKMIPEVEVDGEASLNSLSENIINQKTHLKTQERLDRLENRINSLNDSLDSIEKNMELLKGILMKNQNLLNC